MSKNFQVTFVVRATALTLLLAVCEKSDDIELKEVQPIDIAPQKRHKKTRYANGKRKKDADGAELIMNLAKGGATITTEQIGKAIAKVGYAESSASPLASVLARDGKLTAVGKGQYKITPAKKV